MDDEDGERRGGQGSNRLKVRKAQRRVDESGDGSFQRRNDSNQIPGTETERL